MKKLLYGMLFMLGFLGGAWFIVGDYTQMFETKLQRTATLAIAFIGFMLGATKPDGIMKDNK